jgi:hypothetical protein
VVNQGLLSVQLALTFLVVDSQVLIFNLDFVEQILDLLEVLAVVLLLQCLLGMTQLFLQTEVGLLQINQLGRVKTPLKNWLD